jgi:hypothetical protein
MSEVDREIIDLGTISRAPTPSPDARRAVRYLPSQAQRFAYGPQVVATGSVVRPASGTDGARRSTDIDDLHEMGTDTGAEQGGYAADELSLADAVDAATAALANAAARVTGAARRALPGAALATTLATSIVVPPVTEPSGSASNRPPDTTTSSGR